MRSTVVASCDRSVAFLPAFRDPKRASKAACHSATTSLQPTFSFG